LIFNEAKIARIRHLDFFDSLGRSHEEQISEGANIQGSRGLLCPFGALPALLYFINKK